MLVAEFPHDASRPDTLVTVQSHEVLLPRGEALQPIEMVGHRHRRAVLPRHVVVPGCPGTFPARHESFVSVQDGYV